MGTWVRHRWARQKKRWSNAAAVMRMVSSAGARERERGRRSEEREEAKRGVVLCFVSLPYMGGIQ